MDEVRRLVVEVDLDATENSRLRMSVRAHLKAELADGRRVVVLDDRGWTGQVFFSYPEGVKMPSDPYADTDVWAHETVESLAFTARTVVGPDEPPDGMTYAEVEDGHWDYLAHLLGGRGLATDAATLRGLAMDVELSERVLARLVPSAQP